MTIGSNTGRVETILNRFQRGEWSEDLARFFDLESPSPSSVSKFVQENWEKVADKVRAHPASQTDQVLSDGIVAIAANQVIEEQKYEFYRSIGTERQTIDRVMRKLHDLSDTRPVFSWELLIKMDDPNNQWSLLLNGKEVLREKAYWEDYRTYLAVLECLIIRYGVLLADFVPPQDHVGFVTMYGDAVGAPGRVADLRKRYFGG